jgi:hypothetical protein
MGFDELKHRYLNGTRRKNWEILRSFVDPTRVQPQSAIRLPNRGVKITLSRVEKRVSEDRKHATKTLSFAAR